MYCYSSYVSIFFVLAWAVRGLTSTKHSVASSIEEAEQINSSPLGYVLYHRSLAYACYSNMLTIELSMTLQDVVMALIELLRFKFTTIITRLPQDQNMKWV